MNYSLEHSRLLGVRSSTNHTAVDLETIGLKFREVPKRVELNTFNRLMLMSQVLRPDQFKKSYRMLVLMGNVGDKNPGVYLSDYHAYLTVGNDTFIDRHENTHGYINERSPEIVDSIRKQLDHRIKFVLGRAEQLPDLGKIYPLMCLHEGLGEWTAIRIGLNSSVKSERDFAIKRHNILMSGKFGDGELSNLASFASQEYAKAKRNLEAVQKGLQTHQKILQSHGTSSRVAFAGMKLYRDIIIPANKEIKTASYPVGYYFVRGFMIEAERKGYSVPEAIDWLILNPPTTLEQMRNYGEIFKQFKRTR